MSENSRSPEALSRPYAPERFEYRIWGAAFAGLPAPDEVAESAEVYLVPEQTGVNVKFRSGALEIKQLLGTQDGLQRWLPALRCRLPLPAGVIAQDLCAALGVVAPPLTRQHYALDQLLAEVVPALVAIRVVPLSKRRRSFEKAGARAERTRVSVGEITLESVAVEAERFDLAARATNQLGLRHAPNLDYVAALRLILAGGRPPSPPETPPYPWG
jgi:hypothetical protein